ncbi:uncharacterized protein MYCFIDRAFT_176482 [Pseudocercospora fijiensis CIRAD86]|uniref:Uncharacterized protein n=1 Tax=Pseudocercospora fijiensis (strain CIRAD86) TaxID=383855 RepID=M3A978_PSEFD|nr:uncharacterized protein MYCFIDRAFT_176482 [Pseudocercospora fijiensis CIRAD86]EME81181.1 hypothetical protein MYCFIDRAFT_176482 [Pseudocercospora fijiensis CIRAD86]
MVYTVFGHSGGDLRMPRTPAETRLSDPMARTYEYHNTFASMLTHSYHDASHATFSLLCFGFLGIANLEPQWIPAPPPRHCIVIW